jgi:hypothetical protein
VQRALQKRRTKDELLGDFRESDKTVLITIQEQREEWSEVIPVTEPSLFRGDGAVQMTKKNLAWAEKKAEELHRQGRS